MYCAAILLNIVVQCSSTVDDGLKKLMFVEIMAEDS
jgi:hypothetical protein